MGLLRKAADAATRDDTAPEAPSAPVPERLTEPSGLLKKSLGLRTSVPAATLAVELAPEPVEAADGEAVEELLPEESPQAEELVPEAEPVLEAEEPVPEAEPVLEAAPFPDEEPVPEQAAALRPPVKEVAPPPAPRKQTPDELIEEITAEIQALHGGVELPARLFTLVASRLSIQRGTLLLFDPLRLVYAPWASKGYDQTTLHRLRIPLGAGESWNALANGAPLALADAQSLSPYQPYFSSREFGSVSAMRLAPFIAEGKLIAVLLWTDAAPPFETEAALSRCLARIVEAGSPLVHAARSIQLEKTGDLAPGPQTAQHDETARFVSALSSRPSALLLSLSTEELARHVIGSHEHLDPFRLHEDVRYFIGSFLSDVGTALSIRPGLFMVGLSEFDQSDTGLFLHQLTLFLSGLFGVNGRSGSPAGLRIVKTASWPADGPDLRALVESLGG
jgi:hypothetical protein